MSAGTFGGKSAKCSEMAVDYVFWKDFEGSVAWQKSKANQVVDRRSMDLGLSQ
jgi:hypothetical protein